jgi:hypothetical protein
MDNSSTKQIDAVWIVQSASTTRSYLESIFSNFESFIGPEIREMTTIIITQCDAVMEKGDYYQLPKKGPFKVPEHYNKLKENIRKNFFWVKIMQPG